MDVNNVFPMDLGLTDFGVEAVSVASSALDKGWDRKRFIAAMEDAWREACNDRSKP